MVFENEDVAKALIIFQIQHTVAIAPEHVLHGTFGQCGERCKMVWRFDHNFVRADSIHLVEETLSLAVQFTLDAQCWKLVGHNPDAPAGSIWASTVPPIDEDFRRGSSLIAHAERAILLFPWDDTLTEKVVRTLPSFRRNDHPAARDRVLPQLRQSIPPRTVSTHPRGARTGDSKLYLFCRLREDVPVSPSHLRAESVFVQPYHGRLSWAVINGHDIKPARTFADVTFRKKSLRGANDQVLFFSGNAEFGQCRQVLPDGAGSDFHKCQRLAIVADQIDLAFYAPRSVIAGHKNVSLPTQ